MLGQSNLADQNLGVQVDQQSLEGLIFLPLGVDLLNALIHVYHQREGRIRLQSCSILLNFGCSELCQLAPGSALARFKMPFAGSPTYIENNAKW
jgi:hypothetical protein